MGYAVRVAQAAVLVALVGCGRLREDADQESNRDTPASQGLCQRARALERDGSYGPARKAYEACIRDGGGFVDSHIGYQRILEVEDGAERARQVYEDLRSEVPGPMLEWAAARLQSRKERIKRLDALITVSPDFTPAYYEQSRQYSALEVGAQSLDDKAREKLLLGEFLSRARGSESYRSFFTDYAVASEMLHDAERRIERLGAVDLRKLANPVSIIAMPSNAGWSITFKIEEPASTVKSRKRGDRDFQEGWSLQLPLGVGKETVEVKYEDARGEWHGPFEIPFDPDTAIVAFVKQTLQQVGPRNWIAVQSPTGTPNLYFTTLFVYRCGLAKVEYGIDGDPDKVKPLPPCDMKDPYAIHDTTGIYDPLPAGTRKVSVRVTFADGERSEVFELRVDG